MRWPGRYHECFHDGSPQYEPQSSEIRQCLQLSPSCINGTHSLTGGSIGHTRRIHGPWTSSAVECIQRAQYFTKRVPEAPLPCCVLCPGRVEMFREGALHDYGECSMVPPKPSILALQSSRCDLSQLYQPGTAAVSTDQVLLSTSQQK
jgi:hypothetical protein